MSIYRVLNHHSLPFCTRWESGVESTDVTQVSFLVLFLWKWKTKKKKNVPVTLSAVQQVKTENQPSSLRKKSINLDQPLHKEDQSDVSEPPKRKGWSGQTNFLSKPEGRISTFMAFWKAGTMTNSPFFPYSFTLSSSMELMIWTRLICGARGNRPVGCNKKLQFNGWILRLGKRCYLITSTIDINGYIPFKNDGGWCCLLLWCLLQLWICLTSGLN